MASPESDSPISSLGSIEHDPLDLSDSDSASIYCPSTDSRGSLEMNSEMPEGAEAQPTGSSWENGVEYDGAGQDSGAQDSHEQDFEPSAPLNQFDLRAHDDFTSANGGAADEVGNYDPASVTAPEQAKEEESSPQTAPQPASKKRKTAGGFLVGDSDSEDDDTPNPAQNGLSGSEAAATSLTSKNPNDLSSSTQEAADGPSSNAPAIPQANPAPAVSIPVPSTVALLEARIEDDPRGSTEQWLALMAEHRRQEDTDAARDVYDRFLEIFPQSADVWCDYLEMEIGLSNMSAMEAIFNKALNRVFNVRLWTMYLDYVRRVNDVNNDPNGKARQTLNQTFEFILSKIGIDKDSGQIWQDFIQLIRNGPGVIGGPGWQDQQKMDQLRKAYQRAIVVPLSNVVPLWKEYEQFEHNLNKTTGRKFITDRSPSYMTARAAYTALENITRGLQRSTIPRLPPQPGFDGDEEYNEQVALWSKWIAWEKSDPLVLQSDEPQILQQRILYTYRQALLALRFWPEMWVDAAEWCFANDISEDGKDVGMQFLTDGIEANPESVLLALKHADRIETTFLPEEQEESKVTRGNAVRAPYDKILDTLYGLAKALKEKETEDVGRLEQSLAAASAAAAAQKALDDDDDDRAEEVDKEAEAQARAGKVAMLRQSFAAQAEQMSKFITYVWIALLRAMRRVQGKGDMAAKLGLRGVFGQARAKGRLSSDIYIAVAQMEWKCYADKAGGKIFERGAKLFPGDPHFMIEYLKYMIAHGDVTNSRVVFEKCISHLTSKQETVAKAKPLLAFMHKHEANYGELARVAELEKRMADLFPEDPKLALFNARFSTQTFNPIATRIVVSPLTQLRPKNLALPPIEQRYSPFSPRPAPRPLASPRSQLLPIANSPKRPLEDADDPNPHKMARVDSSQPFVRGVSPLKGAAGRRLAAQQAVSLPRSVSFYLGLLPNASTYQGQRHDPNIVMRTMQTANLPATAPHAFDRPARPTHGSHASADYVQPSYQRNGSPGLGGASYASGTRAPLSSAAATYSQTQQRPQSRDAYESAPPQFAPPPMGGQYPPAQAPPAWMPPPFAGAPPPMPPGFPPPGFPQGPPSQQPPPGAPYGGYRY